MDFAQRLRDALGIEPGVDDDTFVEYVAGLQQFAESNDAPNADQEGDGQPTTPVVTPRPVQTPPVQQPAQQDAPVVDVDALVAARVAAALAPVENTIRDLSGQLAARNASEAATAKERVLASALDDGKITPAAREEWAQNYDAAAEVTTRILASMAPGTAMPVGVKGHSGTNAALAADDMAEYEQFYPTSQAGA